MTQEQDALPFRILNLLEATVNVANGRIASSQCSLASKIYKNPSFGKFESEAFSPKKVIKPFADRTVFQQTVGARTVSPEEIGQGVGAVAGETAGLVTNIPFADKIGREIGRQVGRPIAHQFGFPPIWTTLQLTIFADGRAEGAILCYSLFPSMGFYVLQGGIQTGPRGNSVYTQVGPSYDARPSLERWKTAGWGPLSGSAGPCSGNPWGFNKQDLAARPAKNATRIV